MVEYRYPRKVRRLFLIIVLTGAAVFSVLIMQDTIHMVLSIEPGVNVGGDEVLVYLSGHNVLAARLLIVAAALCHVVLWWALYGAFWLILRRLLNTVYVLNAEDLTRQRGKAAQRLMLSEVVDARATPLRGLILRSGSSRMAVSMNVEAAYDFVKELKHAIVGTGGAFPEETYRKLLDAAENASWQRNMAPWVTGYLFSCGAMILASSALCAAFAASRMACVSAGLGCCLAALAFFGFYTWFGRSRFHDAFRDEWVAPTRAFAWRVAAQSTIATILFWTICGATAVYLMAW